VRIATRTHAGHPWSVLQAWQRRFWIWAGNVNVRTKIIGIVVSVTLLLGAVVAWEVRTVMENTLTDELRNRGFSVASDLASRSVDPILLDDMYELHLLLNNTKANHPDIFYAFVLDPEQQILGHTFDGDGFPVQLLTFARSDYQEDVSGGIKHMRFQSNEGVIHDFSAPIFDGKAGVVHVGLSEQRLQGISNHLTQQIILTTAIIILLGMFAAFGITWILTRPILALVTTAQAIGAGDLNARAPVMVDDEIGELALAFNHMVDDLQASQQALREKEIARAKLLEKLITVQEEERKRIARELHDGIGQELISLMVTMKVATRLQNVNALHEKNSEQRKSVVQILEQVRLLSRELRPSALDDLGVEAALRVFIDEFAQLYPQVKVDLHCELSNRPSPTIEITLYRTIQESMLNAARHSGGDTISVLVSQRKHTILAIIEDNGGGFDVEAERRSGRSMGLHAMYERVDLVNGNISIESSVDGVSVYVEVPVT